MKPKAPYSLKHFWFHLSSFWELSPVCALPPPCRASECAAPAPASAPFLSQCLCFSCTVASSVVSNLTPSGWYFTLLPSTLGRLKKSLVFPKKPHGKTFTWLSEFVLNPCLTFSFEDSGSWTHQSHRLGIRSECNSEKCSYHLDWRISSPSRAWAKHKMRMLVSPSFSVKMNLPKDVAIKKKNSCMKLQHAFIFSPPHVPAFPLWPFLALKPTWVLGYLASFPRGQVISSMAAEGLDSLVYCCILSIQECTWWRFNKHLLNEWVIDLCNLKF